MKKIVVLTLLILLGFVLSFSPLNAVAGNDHVMYVDHSQDHLKAKAYSNRLNREEAEKKKQEWQQKDQKKEGLKAEILSMSRDNDLSEIAGVSISAQTSTFNDQADYSGDFMLMGEVKNTGSTTAIFIEITVKMYDAGSTLLDTDSTYINGGSVVKLSTGSYTNALRSNETGFFKVYTSTPYSSVDHYTYSFSYSTGFSSYAQASLSFKGTPTTSNSLGDLKIVGEIQNNSSTHLTYFTEVYFSIRNSSGKVLDVNSTYVDGTSYDTGVVTTDTAIEPGASASFLTYTDAAYNQYSSYKSAFEWDEVRVSSNTTYTLTVKSTPDTGANVIVSPNDNSGNGNGTTNFTRTYDEGTTVSLTAPSTNNGNDFSGWTVDGTTYTSQTISVTMNSNHTATAVYTSSPPVISLNRTKLYFGHILGGSAPQPQSFRISNSGGGTLNWSIADGPDVPCSPNSGTGDTKVTVSIDPTGLSAGSYYADLKVSAAYASNSPQTVRAYLEIKYASDDQFPFGEFSTPIDGSTVRSSIPVTGWVLDDIGVDHVKIYRGNPGDLVYIGDAVFVEGARPDVEQAYPDYPMNYRAGWGYMMLTYFLPNGGNGTFKIHAIATDVEGQQMTLGTKTIQCDNANAVKPFGAIDTPGQGGTASGSNFINWGWVLTPQPNSIPTNGSTINVYVDGVNLGHPTYNIYRSDIATLFPGYANSNGAIGYFSLDNTAYENGVHTIQWTANDSGGNTDGIGSRYFTIENTGNSQSKVHPVSPISKVIKQKLSRLSQLEDISINDCESIRIKKGLRENSQSKTVDFDEQGIFNIEIEELERIEIDISEKAAFITGYMIIGDQLRPLPIGTTLDIKTGKFYWQPGVGFVGEYRLEFIENGRDGLVSKKTIHITIEPKLSTIKPME